jgi:hypothetical protein
VFLNNGAKTRTRFIFITASLMRLAIAVMDFFTVPTPTFGVLYCFFVIGHDRRKILHFNVTRNPNALWVVQQWREAWATMGTTAAQLFPDKTISARIWGCLSAHNH